MAKKFGIVFHGIANKDNMLIDGHKRKAMVKPEEKVWVFKPSRQLTPDEYKEMNAVYDQATAGDLDLQIIEEQFTDKFMEEWEIDKATPKEVTFKVKEKVVDQSMKYAIIVKCRTEKERGINLNKLKMTGFKAEAYK